MPNNFCCRHNRTLCIDTGKLSFTPNAPCKEINTGKLYAKGKTNIYKSLCMCYGFIWNNKSTRLYVPFCVCVCECVYL